MTNTRSGRASAGRPAAALCTAAAVTAVVFVVVGVLGFIPGVTTNYDGLGFAGPDSTAQLLGLFQVSVLHNVVHLLLGVTGLLMARTARTAFGYFIGGGVIYLVLWGYGLVIGHHSPANFVPVNSADNWLHLGLAAGMIVLGLVLRPRRRARAHTA